MDRAGFRGETRVSGLIARTSRLMQVAMDRRLAKHGISYSQTAALIRLWQAAPKPIAQTDLARDLEMERSSMSTLIGSLERAGLVVALDDPFDGRRRLLRLTPRGRRLERSVAVTCDDWEADLLAGIPPTSVRELHRLMTRVLASARRLREEPVPSNGFAPVKARQATARRSG